MLRFPGLSVPIAHGVAANAGFAGAPAAVAQRGERIATLDFFRGIAILMVICGHFLPQRLVFGDLAASFATMGRGGVIVFFLLSGYLIFKSLQNCNIGPFLCRRFFKIFPAYWLNLLVFFVAGQLGFGLASHSNATYLANFTMLSDLFRLPNVSNVYWTLLIEVKFYLFIALYSHFLKNRFVLAVPVLFTLANAAMFLLRGQASQLLTYFPVFFVGIQVFLAEKSDWADGSLLSLALIALLAGLNVALFDGIYPLWSMAYILGGAAAMAGLLQSGFSMALLAFFGKVSYSNYLYHTLIGYSLLDWIGRQQTFAGNLIAIVGAAVLSTWVAYLSYILVELPAVRFCKTHELRFLGRLSRVWTR
ncbi:acyltransferase [Methylomonas sp. EFPC3]|uniref:acyltransferase family protein n=1 Tax=Methylomonas sp. EFPC3 TaxID=3021710 RepID=UPI00241616E8|nr:acyltransferase [Methylomonas sp. EFPC3]WFP50645.1 acyltransferase [Methylomonas sp. EFPC3]